MRVTRVLMILFALTLLFSVTALADNDYEVNEVYGLMISENVISNNINLHDKVSIDDYISILKFYFKEDIQQNMTPTNSDIVHITAKYVQSDYTEKCTIGKFKDFGLIKKEDRYAYNIMCKAGYLDVYGEFLEPYTPLSYDIMFKILNNFQLYAVSNNSINIEEGQVSDSYSENNSIVLELSTDKGSKEYKFDKNYKFIMNNNGLITPYSYNIKRGQKAKFYSRNGNLSYVSISADEKKLEESLEIKRSKIYVCNEFVNELIFIDETNGRYYIYKYDEELIVYQNHTKRNISDINSILLDLNCYYICDTAQNKIKYINITG